MVSECAYSVFQNDNPNDLSLDVIKKSTKKKLAKVLYFTCYFNANNEDSNALLENVVKIGEEDPEYLDKVNQFVDFHNFKKQAVVEK